ncbi:MAG TPA: hypothetical protein DIW61_14765 [Candidatus Aminicenantes bacterium]|nr:hypothetical protein [Candidatus Aminicenantes bacterium]
MNLINILGAAQGLFLAAILSFRKANSTANRVLAAALVAFSLGILSTVFYATGGYLKFPHFIGLTFSFPFLYGPIIYLYARIVFAGGRGFRRTYWLHFLPFFLVVLYQTPFFFESGGDKIRFFLSLGQRFDLSIINQLKIAHGFAYVFLTIRLIRRRVGELKNAFSNVERINLSWLRNIAVIVTLVWGSAALLHLLEAFAGLRKEIDDLISGVTSLSIYALGYLGLRQKGIFWPSSLAAPGPERDVQPCVHDDRVAAEKTKYAKSGLTRERAQEVLRSLLTLMDKENPYADDQLTIQDLAEALAVSPHHLSEIINTHLGKNFYDFVNDYRVEEVKRRLADPRSRAVTLLAIALDSGFNSKSSFNSVFKKNTGLTPSEYRKRLKSTSDSSNPSG